MINLRRYGWWAVSILLAAAPACSEANAPHRGNSGESTRETQVKVAPRQARAEIGAKNSSGVDGLVTITDRDGQTSLEVNLSGLTPGTHAVHIHANGDCSSEDGTSAGGHWNPNGVDHGRWGTEPFHLGDLGNVEADGTGDAILSMATDLWLIGGGADNDVVGKAIIVHTGADDFVSQPSGAAGPRVGCGVIKDAS